MTYHAGSIANYFLRKAKHENTEDSMTPMKLLKLVYYAHGFYAGIYNEPLISNKIEAWRYGPVIPELYENIKHYGLRPVDEPVQRYDVDFDVWNPYDEPTDKDTLGFLDEVWESYGGLTGIQLSNLSHDREGPWYRVREEKRNSSGAIPNHLEIPYDYIKEYFSNLASAQ